jgi:hypothetical protein
MISDMEFISIKTFTAITNLSFKTEITIEETTTAQKGFSK